MKKFKNALIALAAMLMATVGTSCSDDNNDPGVDDKGEVIKGEYHFDLWVALDRHGGMGRDVQTLVRSLDNLDASQPEISFRGTGTEVNSILSLETIVKGPYYYQVPVSGDRFAKYVIEDNQVIVKAERRFRTNTYSTRKYTHAWLDDNTLVIMAAAGDGASIIWTKLNASDLSIIDEGTLNITLPEGASLFTTSGLLTYRKTDNRLFYFYYAKTGGKRGKRVSPMNMAVITPSTMNIESIDVCPIDAEMVGSAYGELLQPTTIIDGAGNLFIACFTEDADGNEHSHLLRIPAGQTTFDASYDGFTDSGKLISLLYMGNGKAIAYARDDAAGTLIDSFSHYYTVIDLAAKTSTPIKYNGEGLPYSSGRFSSRMAFVNGKAYIGVDAQNTAPRIYIYDAATGTTTLGATMAAGYYFEQIRVVENL